MVATVAAAWGPSSCISAVICDRGTTHCSCSYAARSDAIRQGSLSSIQSTLGHTGSVSSSKIKIVGGRECRGFGSSGLMGNQPIWRLWSWKGKAAKSITSSSNTPRASVSTGTDASEHITVPKGGVENLVGQQGGADGGESSSQPKNGVAYVKKRRQPGGGDGGESSSQAKSAVAEVEKRGQQGVGDEGESSSGEEEELMEKGFNMSRICDRLIEVFLTERTTPTEWRSLLAMSTEWVRIRPHFYKRCKAKARAETVAKRKRELNRLARQVKEVDDSMMRQEKLLAEIEKNTFEIDIVVAQRRKEFTGEFFEHLQTLCEATSRPNRREEIAAIAGKCLSLIEAHDAALEDSEAITEAQLKFDKILNNSSLEAAANQINQLAQSKELDSTLLLLITRAWVAAKDSTTMKQEVKGIMCYLYSAAKRSMLKLVPDEIHIIKYLLSIPDPRDRFAAMTSAFAPGDELEEKIENKFHTSPEKLKHWIKLLVDAYHSHKQSTTIKEARKLMNPEAISRLEILLEYMDDTFIV